MGPKLIQKYPQYEETAEGKKIYKTTPNYLTLSYAALP